MLQPEFVSKEIQHLVSTGVLKQTNSPSYCTSPLTVATKTLPDGRLKHRLCWDGSRSVNRYIQDEHLHFSSLADAADLMEELDFQATFDLSSAYHHLRIHEDQLCYLGIAWDDGTGIKYYQFQVLPFGVKSAAHAITRLLRPLMLYFHAHGIRISMYIDDGRICCKSLLLAKDQYAFVLATLQAAGFVLSFPKSDTLHTISQIKPYLGFVLDSVQMKIFVSDAKLADVLHHVNVLLTRSKPSLKSASSVLGKIVALQPALGPICHVLTRALYWDVDLAQTSWSWKGFFRPSQDATTALLLFTRLASSYNGFPVRRQEHYRNLHYLADHQLLPVMAGDASANMVCSYSSSIYFQQMLTTAEEGLSSGHRELLTVLYTLQHHSASLKAMALSSPSSRLIVWFTDSMNMVHFLTYGSRKPAIQHDVLRIFQMCLDIGISIHPIHLSREDPRIQCADEGTRIVDKQDWGLSLEDFQELQQGFQQFTLDLFASPTNFKVERYYSLYTWSDALAVDAFSQPWTNEILYACPPTNLILPTWRRLQTTSSPAVLIVPRWPAALFWPVLCPDGRNVGAPASAVRILDPVLQLGQLHSGVFRHVNSFKFLAIYFNSAAGSLASGL